MSRYRKIDPDIWHDEKYRDLGEREKLFFFYLLSSPHSTPWGAYVLDDLYIQADVGFSLQIIKTCWTALQESELVLRCKRTRLVCLPNWFKYNKPVNEKSRKACLAGLVKLPQCPTRTQYFNSSEWVRGQLANSYLIVSETGDTEQEQEQEQEQDITVQNATHLERLFGLFWKAYPKKRHKKKAELVFKKIAPDQDLFTKIMQGLEAVKKTDGWLKENGEYVPLPTTWLNGELWNDDLKTGAGYIDPTTKDGKDLAEINHILKNKESSTPTVLDKWAKGKQYESFPAMFAELSRIKSQILTRQ